ncbi:hypothetical protein ABKN59_010322 [Abortiporus biennis]
MILNPLFLIGGLSFKSNFVTLVGIFLLTSTCLAASIPQTGGASHSSINTQSQSSTQSKSEKRYNIAVTQFLRDEHDTDYNVEQWHWAIHVVKKKFWEVSPGDRTPAIPGSHVVNFASEDSNGSRKILWEVQSGENWKLQRMPKYRGGVFVGSVPIQEKDLKELYDIWNLKPSPAPSTENGYCRTWVIQVLQKFKEKGWISHNVKVDDEKSLFPSMKEAAKEAIRRRNEGKVPQLVKYVPPPPF